MWRRVSIWVLKELVQLFSSDTCLSTRVMVCNMCVCALCMHVRVYTSCTYFNVYDSKPTSLLAIGWCSLSAARSARSSGRPVSALQMPHPPKTIYSLYMCLSLHFVVAWSCQRGEMWLLIPLWRWSYLHGGVRHCFIFVVRHFGGFSLSGPLSSQGRILAPLVKSCKMFNQMR